MSGAPNRLVAVGDPVFLVGSERSGSTLLAHMLDHHPELAWALALEFAGGLLRAPDQWPPLPTVHDRLRHSWYVRRTGLRIDPRLTYVELVHDFLEQERARKGKGRIGATVHRDFDRLPWLFPAGRFIHLLRDPRDVSRSAIGLGFVGNVWGGARRWVDAERRWDALCAHVAPARRYEVRYEQLIRHPADTLRGICAFIGVPYSAAMLGYPADTNFGPADATRIASWRHEAAPADVRVIEAVAGDLLEARGYQPSGLAPLRIGLLRRLWWREHDRYRRIRFRVARNGVWLTAADFCARRARLHGYARRLQKRIDDIEMQLLR